MSQVRNSAQLDPDLARALGEFSQACVQLERTLEWALFRLLPVTDNIGRVLFSGNQMRRNIEIMKALTILPDVPLDDEMRTDIQSLCSRCDSINQDRSRLLHNPIIMGENGYFLIQHKQDGKGSAAMPISTAFIRERTEEAVNVTQGFMMKVPSLEYDLSQWKRASPSYPVKDYPKAQKPARQPHNPRKRSDQTK